MSSDSPSPVVLKQRTIAGAEAGPHLLITGGVHGDEYEPMVAIRTLIREIDPRQLRGRVTLVPVVNEAAYERGSRTAEDRLDLARTCPGRPDGSITERIAAALATLIRAADLYIDLHTGGTALALFPLSGYVLHDDARVLSAQRRMAKALDLPLIWGTSNKLDGRSLSVARDANVPAIYAEHGGGGGCDERGVRDYVEGCLNVLAEFEMLDRVASPHASRVRHVIEDPRDRSGHLQIQHPAPMSGFFEPAVSLGQTVRVGQVVGSVCDALGDEKRDVLAAEDGSVVMLRVARHVNAGDALAGLAASAYAREGQGEA